MQKVVKSGEITLKVHCLKPPLTHDTTNENVNSKIAILNFEINYPHSSTNHNHTHTL